MGQGERPIEDFHAIRDAGGIFYVSHSGGKDSQAMYAMLIDLIPADQIVVVHADLGEVLVRGLGTTLIDGKHKGNPDYWTLAKVLKATPEGIAQNVELITEWRYYDGSGYLIAPNRKPPTRTTRLRNWLIKLKEQDVYLEWLKIQLR